MIDETTGQRRKAFADELTQPQQLFLFYAKETRKEMRHGDGGSSPQNDHSQTHQIT